MRTLLLVGGAVALAALPAAALSAGSADEPVPETDPIAESAPGTVTTTTDKALHVAGRGAFRYEGSGGVVLSGQGSVRVTDLSAGGDLSRTPAGLSAPAAGAPGATTVYSGEGTLTLDGSSYRVSAAGRFAADVDPTAAHPAAGEARVAGSGESIAKGGIPVPYWANRRIVLATGSMSVDLAGRGGPEWWRDRPSGPAGRGARAVTLRRTVITTRARHGAVVATRTVVALRRWWRWDAHSAGATWRLDGPASGTVRLSLVTGRIRVWDGSAGADLSVVVPAGTGSATLADGSVLYSGLRGATATVSGTGFRMKVRGTDVTGAFTPAPGTLARGFVRGAGSFDAGDAIGVSPGRHGGVRVLLQPAPAGTSR